MSDYSIILPQKSIPEMETDFYTGIFNMLGGYATTCGICNETRFIPDNADPFNMASKIRFIAAKYSFKHVYPAVWVHLWGHEIVVYCKFSYSNMCEYRFSLEQESNLLEDIRDAIIYIYNLALREVIYNNVSCPGKRDNPDILVSLELTYLDLEKSTWLNIKQGPP